MRASKNVNHGRNLLDRTSPSHQRELCQSILEQTSTYTSSALWASVKVKRKQQNKEEFTSKKKQLPTTLKKYAHAA